MGARRVDCARAAVPAKASGSTLIAATGQHDPEAQHANRVRTAVTRQTGRSTLATGEHDSGAQRANRARTAASSPASRSTLIAAAREHDSKAQAQHASRAAIAGAPGGAVRAAAQASGSVTGRRHRRGAGSNRCSAIGHGWLQLPAASRALPYRSNTVSALTNVHSSASA